MKEIIDKCKCGVYLNVNSHRDIYQSIQDRIEEVNSRESGPYIDDELIERMIKTNQFYELQFYPDTPIGFYVVYGTSLDEVIEKAKECLE